MTTVFLQLTVGGDTFSAHLSGADVAAALEKALAVVRADLAFEQSRKVAA